MFVFLTSLLRFILSLLFNKAKKELLIENAILKKEIEILKRKLDNKNKRVNFIWLDRLFITLFSKLTKKLRSLLNIVKPETVLKWQRQLSKKQGYQNISSSNRS